jgi:hypothetical protein
MELFYKAFYLVRAFLLADAKVPPPVALPDAEDRYVTQELESRRDFPVLQVLDVLRQMSQTDLLQKESIQELVPTAQLSEASGLVRGDLADSTDMVSLAPSPQGR